MTIRLGRPKDDWLYADGDQEITFDKETERTVKMEVRTEVRSSLFADFGDGQVFLCVVDGYENVEFIASGAFVLTCDGPFYVRTADSTHVGLENQDAEIFTKMHERRPIAPEILEMQRLMHKNAERERAKIMRDFDGLLRARDRADARRRAEEEEARRAAADAAASGGGSDDNDDASGSDGGATGKAAKSKPKAPASD